MTVNERLTESLYYGLDLLTYTYYWAIKNGVSQPQDDECKLNLDLIDHEDVKKMRERNELGIQSIKLYSMETTPGMVLLVLAENEHSARGEYLNELGILPKLIVDMSDRMDMSFWIEEIRVYKSVREMQDETLMFPVTLFEYEK